MTHHSPFRSAYYLLQHQLRHHQQLCDTSLSYTKLGAGDGRGEGVPEGDRTLSLAKKTGGMSRLDPRYACVCTALHRTAPHCTARPDC